MPEAIPNSRQEFWLRPVVGSLSSHSSSGESLKSCVHCGTEFMAGSRFCYLCGAKRESLPSSKPWTTHLSFPQVFGFRRLMRSLGLPSLIAFLAGIGCLIATVREGVVFLPTSPFGFQALQLVRIEWLLGAIAAFVAGMLLKDTGSRK